ncbi:cyclic nucleotide-gated ion channel 1 [Neltuma alba]|uniref:cyclic nucleotide-gated ion channel 1 n=1 Tax=Neltuma alba TaxID=207710 RepID=UPI0010A4D216|nr:cyclic nucleotide-gated ion channel 1-like [Prosopis alba]XP_028794755.1 cyclic nucleotide-gated ion channel 1-like [Prosopis alba]
MDSKRHKFVRFDDQSSESSSNTEQKNSSNNGYHGRKLRPSVSAALDSIKRRLENGSDKIKNFRKSSTVHPISDRPPKTSAPRRKILDPQGSFLQRWNKIFVFTSVMAVSVDPLFFYIPAVGDKGKCLELNGNLQIIASVLRTFFDLFYILHITFQFQTGFIAPSSRVFGRGELVNDPRAIMKRYLSTYFIIDVLSILPLPQVVVLFIIPKLKSSVPFVAKDLLTYMVLIQYVPRVWRIRPLFKEVTRTSGILTETAWAGAAYNLCLYMLASHLVGAFWYLLSVQSELRCWHRALESTKYNDNNYLGCGNQNATVVSLLTDSCAVVDPSEITNSTTFNFGIYADALQSGVVNSTTDFPQKFFYCFWWGLRNLSSLGQNLKTSTYVPEIIFAICIAVFGLVLFSLLIGNMQKYLQSTTVRVEEMRVKRRDAEQWMSHRMLPENLRERIRRYEHYKWQENRGVEEEALIRNLPKDLRRDIKRHLCLALLKKVPIFEKMDEQLLDAMCDRLKPILYTEKSYIVREGDPVDEMLFIMRGKLATTTTNGGRTGFFNSSVLQAGDFCGEELLTWALDPNTSSNLPISTRTVESISEVEAFALMPDDLKFVTSQFRRLHSKRLQHTFRFYSLQWKTWGACFIQAAWRRYCRKKMERSLREAEERLLANESGSSSTPSLGATIYASRFAANALRNLRQNSEHNSRMTQRLLPLLPQKPSEPDFTSQSH